MRFCANKLLSIYFNSLFFCRLVSVFDMKPSATMSGKTYFRFFVLEATLPVKLDSDFLLKLAISFFQLKF